MPRPRTHDDTVRRRLLEQASAAIAEDGASGLSLRAVASAAGTSTSAIYGLFGSREALIEAVVDEGFRRFAEHLAGSAGPEPRSALFALGLAYRANALANPHFYRVIFTDSARARLDRSRASVAADETFQVLVRAVARVLETPEAAAAEAPARRLWAYVHGLVSLELAGLMPGSDQDRDQAYRDGLRAGIRLLEPIGSAHG